jgi:hypothetical protein
MKIKSLFFLALSVTTSPLAIASGPQIEQNCGVTTQCSASENYAQKIKALFDGGSFPSTLDVGAYAGRCYATGPTVTLNFSSPSASLLVVADRSDANNEGPLFPSTGKELAITLGSPTDTTKLPNFYDDGQNLDGLDEIFSKALTACEKNDALVSPSPDYPTQEDYEIRQNGDYFIGKLAITIDVPNQHIKAGDAYAYCYYFKKVK